MTIEYRKAILEDAHQISILFSQVYIHVYAKEGVSKEFAIAIEKQFSVPSIERDIVDQECSIWLATCNKNPIAVLKIYLDKKCPNQSFSAPEVHKLYMLSHFYGKGIAQRLLQRGEEELRQAGKNKVWLWVLESNERAIRFYEKENYQPIGKADLQLSENRYTNTVMSKEL